MDTKLITTCIPPDAVVGVGVSGGVDSTALLHLAVKALGAERVVALHFEHGIRGEAARADEAFVCEYAASLSVRCVVGRADVPALAKQNKVSVETQARRCRKQFFQELMDGGEVDCIALAHNSDDQKETVLMHLLRGCGIAGLVGMRSEFPYFRPLLDVSRRQIIAYATQNGLVWREDATNADLQYDRNYVRKVLIPAIEERYDANSLLRLSQIASQTEAYLAKTISTDGVRVGRRAAFVPIAQCSPVVGERLVIAACKAAGLTEDLESKHVFDILALISSQNGAEICLPNGYRAAREYDELAIYLPQKQEEEDAAFGMGMIPFARGTVCVLPTDEEPKKGVLVFDFDKVPSTAVFRFRRDGDRFTPFGGGRRKLKEYLIDRKIPSRVRDELIVLADGKEALAVLGVEISRSIRLDENTTMACKLTYEEDDV